MKMRFLGLTVAVVSVLLLPVATASRSQSRWGAIAYLIDGEYWSVAIVGNLEQQPDAEWEARKRCQPDDPESCNLALILEEECGAAAVSEDSEWGLLAMGFGKAGDELTARNLAVADCRDDLAIAPTAIAAVCEIAVSGCSQGGAAAMDLGRAASAAGGESASTDSLEGDAPTGPAGMEFVWIPAGEFRMGNFAVDLERPITRVRISEGFWLGKYEVTQEEWESVMGSDNPSEFSGCPRCPVERVSWNHAQDFVERLNALEGRDTYRLPTEAEWEYAARAGTAGDRYGDLDEIAWWTGNSGRRTHPVGQKVPNEFGLHDTLGNVSEWVYDWQGDYPGGSVTDPQGPSSGFYKVSRGCDTGCWAHFVRVSLRSNGFAAQTPYVSAGFRLLRMTSKEGQE